MANNNEWVCPVCAHTPQPNLNECVCGVKQWLYIPAGQHRHIQCPVHGNVIMEGSDET